jgi:hypothetical protein
MVTMAPPQYPVSSMRPFTWRWSEAFWPDLPSSCGLDTAAARLLRSSLTLAVEQMLEQWRETGASLPPTCPLHQVRQRRFDPAVVHWERRDELQALLITEARLLFGLARRPLGGRQSKQWAEALAQQCRRIGCLYQALARRDGPQAAISDLAMALEQGGAAPV